MYSRQGCRSDYDCREIYLWVKLYDYLRCEVRMTQIMIIWTRVVWRFGARIRAPAVKDSPLRRLFFLEKIVAHDTTPQVVFREMVADRTTSIVHAVSVVPEEFVDSIYPANGVIVPYLFLLPRQPVLHHAGTLMKGKKGRIRPGTCTGLEIRVDAVVR